MPSSRRTNGCCGHAIYSNPGWQHAGRRLSSLDQRGYVRAEGYGPIGTILALGSALEAPSVIKTPGYWYCMVKVMEELAMPVVTVAAVW